MRKWNSENQDKVIASRMKKTAKPEYQEANKVRCLSRYYKNRDQIIANRAEVRAEMVAAYGGECVCCGEDREQFLTIDHVIPVSQIIPKKSARRLRADVPANLSAGERLYNWLRKNGYPRDGYQLMCWNCNRAKQRCGVCPHEVERRRSAMKIAFD